MHDAAEAYCQDIPAPLKALLPDYRRIEAFVDELIRFKFNLPLTPSPEVKYADLKMLATERRDLDISDDDPWPMLEDITSPTKYWYLQLNLTRREACLCNATIN